MPELLFQNSPAISPEDQFFLERPRIDELLEKALGNSVVTITAGEGYGKTYAAASFLRRRKKAAVWVPLSERDNSPLRFWENVGKAIGFHNPEARKRLAEIGFPETADQVSRCLLTLQDVVSDNKKHIIVADDFHLIHAGPILRFLERFLAAPFPNRTFFLISRNEPEINTVPLLSKGLLSRIDADDLRFNEEETAAYFKLRNMEVSPGELGEILADTEGWALAINLLADEIKRKKQKYDRRLLEKGSFRAMEDRLFESNPESIRRFLILISLFEQWPLDLLEKLAASLPAELPRIEEFTGNVKRLGSVIRYDTYLHGFRIHRVFLDYLREKLKEIPLDQIKKVTAQAAKWCMENNLRMDAALNYETAGDYQGLINVIYSFPRIFSRAAAASILEILERVFSGQYRDEDDENFMFLRHVARPRLLANTGKFAEAAEEFHKSISKFDALPPSPLSSWILSACYNNLGAISIYTYRRTKDFNCTVTYFQRGNYYYMRWPRPAPAPVTKATLSSYVNQVAYPSMPNEYETAIRDFGQCIPHASNSLNGYLSGIDSLSWAELAYFRGDLAAAEQYAREAIFKAHEKGQYETENRGLFYLLRVHLHAGNIQAMRDTLRQMENQLDIPDFINRYTVYDIMAGWFYVHIGENEKLAPWLKNESFEKSELNTLFNTFEAMVQMKYFYAIKQYREMLAIMEQHPAIEVLASFLLGKLELAVLEAAARNRLEDTSGALKALEAAYKTGASNSFDMPFVEMGEDMRLLAGAALADPACVIPRQWLESIRSRASAYGKMLCLAAESFGKKDERDAAPYLTKHERTVLSGLSRGFSREEIAEDTNLSVSTVKSIIKSLYSKLGALNRADAIRIATRYGILPKE
jgi:LuxR family maltose regulon positive regulatory protein